MNLHFLYGLLVGDGSFQINHYKKKYIQYRIIIKLKHHHRNISMLQEARDTFRVGTIIVRPKYVI
jgi:hypothetical protein